MASEDRHGFRDGELAIDSWKRYNPCTMNIEPEYQETLDYLYRFVDYSMVRNLRYSPEKFDLSRMYAFVAALGKPQNRYPILHVAGTKGKGSVSALCASALHAAGFRVGLYTSPHLIDFAERMQVDGQPIRHRELVNLVNEQKTTIESIPELTTFEITTALAFLYFALREVDIAVIEVGLGGRLDPTNVATPKVAVITSISYDHTGILGNTLSAIAREKAGIIKPGVPVVSSPQQKEARLVIERVAAELEAPLTQVGVDYLYRPVERSLAGQSLEIWTSAEQARFDDYISARGEGGWQPERLEIPLLGHHQAENAATAFAALQVARGAGLDIEPGAIRQGFSEVKWPGRFEILQHDPILLLDAAHNRDSALKLRLAVDDYFPGKTVLLVYGASEDKDVDGMFTELLPRIREVIATQSIHPRALEPEAIVAKAQQHGSQAQAIPLLEDALAEALRRAEPDTVVLVTGSVFVVAAARQVWLESSASGSSTYQS